MPTRILTLDIGSSSIKAGICQLTPNKKWKLLSHLKLPHTTLYQNDRAEIPPQQILTNLQHIGSLLLKKSPHIDAISFCAFSSALIITDTHFRPRTNIITHADRRSTDIAQHLITLRPKKWWLTRTGNLPYPGGIASSTLAWLHQHQPKLFTNSPRIGQLSSLISHLLTGQWTIDPSQATFLGLYDIRHHRWNPEVCQLIGAPLSSLPTLQFADQPLGTLTPKIAQLWNLPLTTLVLGGFVDTSAAILQTPMHNGQLTHNAGSTDVLAMCINQPHPTEGILTRPLGTGKIFPPKWLAVRTIASSGTTLDWAKKTLFPNLTDPQWSQLLQHAAKLAQKNPTPTDLTCTPHFAGDRASISQSHGATLSHLTLATTPENILAALLQSLITESSHNYQILSTLHPPQKKVFTLGGAKTLEKAMHHHWPQHHTFTPLTSDSLLGLAQLALPSLLKKSFESPPQ